MRNLKPSILFVAIAIAFVACTDNDSLEKKKETLEVKKSELTDLRAEIKQLELEIAQLDSAYFKNNNEILIASFPVQVQPFYHKMEVRGTVQSRKNVIVSAETMARLVKLNVSEGQEVSKGEILAEMDASILRNNIAEVETSLDLAKTIYQRQASLWEQQIGTEVQYLQAKNNVESLERRMVTLKSQLQSYIIRAPFDGTVDAVNVLAGEMVQPGMPMARIVNQKDMYLKMDVSEASLGKFNPGDVVEVVLNGGEKTFKTTITAISKVINNQNRTFSVDVELPKERMKDYQPNQVVNVRLVDYKNESAIAIPTRLIQSDDNGKFVYVIDQFEGRDIARKARVKPGLSYNSKTEIISGLTKSDKVIDQGYRDVSEGAEVKLAKL